jgi:preprotein translocase subunit Sss1
MINYDELSKKRNFLHEISRFLRVIEDSCSDDPHMQMQLDDIYERIEELEKFLQEQIKPALDEINKILDKSWNDKYAN